MPELPWLRVANGELTAEPAAERGGESERGGDGEGAAPARPRRPALRPPGRIGGAGEPGEAGEEKCCKARFRGEEEAARAGGASFGGTSADETAWPGSATPARAA
mmetsp:Transcript_11536/g.24235  ORF Transcript_11536/g.24235 Transcript_11536/m.24235 type:complete len:105 (+) Transcript_11536:306-620(+)